jgi:hypothetical protein
MVPDNSRLFFVIKKCEHRQRGGRRADRSGIRAAIPYHDDVLFLRLSYTTSYESGSLPSLNFDQCQEIFMIFMPVGHRVHDLPH